MKKLYKGVKEKQPTSARGHESSIQVEKPPKWLLMKLVKRKPRVFKAVMYCRQRLALPSKHFYNYHKSNLFVT